MNLIPVGTEQHYIAVQQKQQRSLERVIPLYYCGVAEGGKLWGNTMHTYPIMVTQGARCALEYRRFLEGSRQDRLFRGDCVVLVHTTCTGYYIGIPGCR